jgi:hypothetical protein|tara:strand:- start:2484 stop:2807 length:324 start_codon:yes stop_codon:yes gene_type:complete
MLDSLFAHSAFGEERSSLECAEYLCPEYAGQFATYLETGCEGDFSATSIDVEELVSTGDGVSDEVGISTTSMVAVAGSCGMVALIVGFVSGYREIEDEVSYKPLPMA